MFASNYTVVDAEARLASLPLAAVCLPIVAVCAIIALVLQMVYRRPKPHSEGEDAGKWIINGKVYDLGPFMGRHPGGQYILEVSQGRDCTAIFHSYHAVSTKPITKMMEKFYVRDATSDEQVDSKIWEWDSMPFYDELQREVRTVLGGSRAATKASIAHLLQYAVATVGLVVSMRAWLGGSTLAGVVMGHCIWLCCVDVIHAATHYAVFVNPELNVVVGWLFGWFHHVPAMWMRQHVLGHHPYTNVPGLDPDLEHFTQFEEVGGGWRLSGILKPVVVNHWRRSLLPIASIAGIGPLVGETLQALAAGAYMKYIPLKLVPGEVGLTLLHMSTCVYLGIVLPLWANRSLLHALLPWVVHGVIYYMFSSVSHGNEKCASSVKVDGVGIIDGVEQLRPRVSAVVEADHISRAEGAAVEEAAASLVLELRRQGKGKGKKGKKALPAPLLAASPATSPLTSPSGSAGTSPDGTSSSSEGEGSSSSDESEGEGRMTRSPRERKEWAAHQVETSQGDYAPTSVLWGLVSIGLNNQAMHHVFPGIHPCHYPRLTPVLKRVCKKHGVSYHAYPSLFQSLKAHLLHLCKLNDAPEPARALEGAPAAGWSKPEVSDLLTAFVLAVIGGEVAWISIASVSQMLAFVL